MNGLDAPEKPVRASLTRNRSRSPTAVGSMAMMGQKNKRSQAAYPRRYLGTSAENQGSRSEHHGSGRSETAVVPTQKEHSNMKLVGPTWATVGSILRPGLKKRADGRCRPSRALENGFGSEKVRNLLSCHRSPQALQSSPGAGSLREALPGWASIEG